MSNFRKGGNRRAFRLSLAALAFAGQAFAGATPQVSIKDGDLYLKKGAKEVRLTYYGHNSSFLVAPNGQWVVYFSRPNWKVAAPPCLEEGGGSQCYVNNVWLMNLNTRKAWKLAGQTKETWNLNTNTSRTVLLWSPDSRQVAWFECTGMCEYDSAAPGRLQVAQVDSRAIKTLNLAGSGCSAFDVVGLPAMPAAYDWPQPAWGSDRLALFCKATVQSGASNGGTSLAIVPLKGRFRFYPLPNIPKDHGAGDLKWLGDSKVQFSELGFNRQNFLVVLAHWTLDLNTGRWVKKP